MKTINKELFIKNIDIMINNSSKGASGFWYDTEDCCGNPEVLLQLRKDLKNTNQLTWNMTSVRGTEMLCMETKAEVFSLDAFILVA